MIPAEQSAVVRLAVRAILRKALEEISPWVVCNALLAEAADFCVAASSAATAAEQRVEIERRWDAYDKLTGLFPGRECQ
jgi:hypothetical protein